MRRSLSSTAPQRQNWFATMSLALSWIITPRRYCANTGTAPTAFLAQTRFTKRAAIVTHESTPPTSLQHQSPQERAPHIHHHHHHHDHRPPPPPFTILSVWYHHVLRPVLDTNGQPVPLSIIGRWLKHTVAEWMPQVRRIYHAGLAERYRGHNNMGGGMDNSTTLPSPAGRLYSIAVAPPPREDGGFDFLLATPLEALLREVQSSCSCYHEIGEESLDLLASPVASVVLHQNHAETWDDDATSAAAIDATLTRHILLSLVPTDCGIAYDRLDKVWAEDCRCRQAEAPGAAPVGTSRMPLFWHILRNPHLFTVDTSHTHGMVIYRAAAHGWTTTPTKRHCHSMEVSHHHQQPRAHDDTTTQPSDRLLMVRERLGLSAVLEMCAPLVDVSSSNLRCAPLVTALNPQLNLGGSTNSINVVGDVRNELLRAHDAARALTSIFSGKKKRSCK